MPASPNMCKVVSVTQTPARKPYRRGEGSKLRADIIAAAATLIEETGSEQSVTLREVARRIGIAAPSIYEHFPNRDAIVYAVVDDCSSQLRTAIEQAMDSQPGPLARLQAGCTAYLRFADQRPGQYRVLFSRYQHLADRRPDRAAIRTQALNLLITALRDCASAGQITTDDPRADAVIIWSALHGYATLRASLPLFDLPAPEAALDRILSRYAPRQAGKHPAPPDHRGAAPADR
jgi:AcrR family transcriptional regulator